MSLPICNSCPSSIRSWCSRVNAPLHKEKKEKGKVIEPALSEAEKVCVAHKHIYAVKGREEVFYEGGILQSPEPEADISMLDYV